MAAKILQGLGILALLGLVGGFLGALALLSQRYDVTLTREHEAQPRGPDPLDLVRADLEQLKSDLGALNEGLGRGLESLEGAAAARGEVLHQDNSELREQLAALEVRVDALASRVPSSADIPGTPRVPETESARAPPVAVPTVEGSAVRAAEPRAPASTPGKKSFLSFELPSDSFAFDRPMRLEILPSLSRVGFDAKSTLHDFSGVSSRVTGELTTCLARPQENCQGEVRVEVASLATGEPDRDAEMRKTLALDTAPILRFEVSAFELAALDASAQKLSGTVRGRMTIHGTTLELSIPVRVSVDSGKRVVIEGETKLDMSAYGVVPPTKLGMIRVEDEVKIWIALRARSLGTVGGEKQ